MLTLNLIILAVSLAVIFWSADRLLIASVALSDRWQISPLIVGAVVIGFGTSSPELAVSLFAALDDESLVAIGNAFGSNIANLSLVGGSAALLARLCIDRQTLTQHFPLVTLATLLPGLLILDLFLSRTDAIILLSALGMALFFLLRKPSHQTDMPKAMDEDKSMHQAASHLKNPGIWLAIGLTVLLLSCDITVRMAIAIAETLEISKLIIGLTIVAIGTSLPELAAALISIYRKQHSIAVGNILGSNIFNSLGVLGIATLIRPTTVPAELLHRDFVIMFSITLLVWLFYAVSQKLCIGRKEGLLLVSIFVAYLSWLYFSTMA